MANAECGAERNAEPRTQDYVPFLFPEGWGLQAPRLLRLVFCCNSIVALNSKMQ